MFWIIAALIVGFILGVIVGVVWENVAIMNDIWATIWMVR